jgi:hypothetical protein
MTATIIGISIAITIIATIIRFAVWIFWPVKVDELDQHEMLTADWEKRS